jgi:hypothetical protein
LPQQNDPWYLLLCVNKLSGDTTCPFGAVLPFLERTTFFLYPIGLLVILFPICEYLSIIALAMLFVHDHVVLQETKFNFVNKM